MRSVSNRVSGRIRGGLWRLSILGLARGPRVTRYAMYQRLGAVGARLGRRQGDVLAVSRSKNLCEVLGIVATTLTEADYPAHSILDLKFPDEAFDFVLSDQVLEHVEGDPQQAIDECFRVLRPGGVAIHTTCFVNPIHEAPNDYWRFTPEALKLLTRGASEIIDVDGWGNFEVWLMVRNGLRFDGVPHARWHPLHRIATRDDPEWPIVTWVVARK